MLGRVDASIINQLTLVDTPVRAGFPSPADDSRLIIQAAQKGLQAIYKKGFLFMKAGVMLLDLHAKHTDTPYDLFEMSTNVEQKKKNDKLLDLNGLFTLFD
ncbi:hypothetical protein A9G34_04225 [Gilliamella sp. Choc4-2]|nr:hypothetical protein A9G34_04225 [Gilliamella apicola]